jgi:hypothetical protein
VKRRNSKSGCIGVYFIKSKNIWQAYGSKNDVRWTRNFKTFEEAVKARKDWEKQWIE